MKKLRLLLTEDCNRNCAGCCNKDWDLKALPVVESFTEFNEVYITGGEPMLYPCKIQEVIHKIQFQSMAKIFIYTADIKNNMLILADILMQISGITFTLHEQKDVPDFEHYNHSLLPPLFDAKSMRLNVFDGVDISDIDTDGWIIKTGIKWIKNSPLPKDEVFMRYER